MKNSIAFMIFLFLLAASGPLHAYELGPIEIHGFASQGYLKSTDNNYLSVETKRGSYEYNEVGINFSTSLTDRLRLGIQLISRDLGDVGNNEVKLDWAVADYKWRDELSLRFGKVKRPMGLYNEGRDVDMLRTFVFLPQGIYSEAMRDYKNSSEGFGVYGTVTAGDLGSFDYQSVLGAPSLNARETKEAQLLLVAVPSLSLDDVDVTMYYASDSQVVWNTPVKGLRLGGAITYSKTNLDVTPPAPMPGFDFNLEENGSYVLSVEYQNNGLTLAAEYQLLDMEVGINLPGIDFDSLNSESYYGSASYRFTDWLEAGAYYSVHYMQKEDRDGDFVVSLGYPDYAAWQKEAVLTLRFDINPHWIMKLEGHRINGVAQVFDGIAVADLEENWSLFAAKTTVSF